MSSVTVLPVEAIDENKLNAVLEQLVKLNKRSRTIKRTVNEILSNQLAQEKKWEEMTSQGNNEKFIDVKIVEKKDELYENRQLLTGDQVYNSIIKPEIQHMGRVEEYYKEAISFTWTLTDFKNLLTGSSKELLSEDFVLANYRFSARAKLSYVTDVKFKLHLEYKDPRTAEKTPPTLLPNLIYTFVVTFNGSTHTTRSDAPGHTHLTKASFGVFYEVGEIEIPQFFLDSPTYDVDDTPLLLFHLEPPEVAQVSYSHNGVLTWAIRGYRQRKWAESEEAIWGYRSPYFYTSPKGYRVFIRVYLNGFNNYKGLSMRLYFLMGPNDAAIAQSWPNNLTVTIFHPTQPTRYVIRRSVHPHPEVVKPGPSSYVVNVGSHKQIENMLCDDTLYYQVSIEAA